MFRRFTKVVNLCNVYQLPIDLAPYIQNVVDVQRDLKSVHTRIMEVVRFALIHVWSSSTRRAHA